MKFYKIFFRVCLLLFVLNSTAQTPVVPGFKGAIKSNRVKTYDFIVAKSITQNLSQPLTDSTEEDWEEAFYGIELVHYNQPWINEKIALAFTGIEKRTIEFQRSLLELLYATKNNHFVVPVKKLLEQTGNAKLFAMCAEYLFKYDLQPATLSTISLLAAKTFLPTTDPKTYAIINSVLGRTIDITTKHTDFIIEKKLFAKDYLKGNVIIYSIQRKNRNYPGLVIIKDTSGTILKDTTGNIFSVTQLARSITDLPGYLTNGNTPQGLFRMYGFDVSKSPALGPTQNIQLTMPYETSVQHFLKDSSITDTLWTLDLYKKLLPASRTNYYPLYETFYASQAGRTEIISHGTTVDPDYYKGQTYFPYTPTQGCLCTKEIWSAVDGKRLISDQQKLIDAVKKAGGADGYLIVIEIDDQQKPVSVEELLPYLKK